MNRIHKLGCPIEADPRNESCDCGTAPASPENGEARLCMPKADARDLLRITRARLRALPELIASVPRRTSWPASTRAMALADYTMEQQTLQKLKALLVAALPEEGGA